MTRHDSPVDLRWRKWTCRNRIAHGGHGRIEARLVRMLFAACILSCLPVGVADAIDGAALQKGPGGLWHIVLPTEMSSALKDSFPNFQLWPDSLYDPVLRARFRYTEQESPFAQIWDLNQDGFEDVVLDGRMDSAYVVVMLRSQGNRYAARAVIRRSATDSGPRAPGRGLRMDPLLPPRESGGHGEIPPRWLWWYEPGRRNEATAVEWPDSSKQVREMTLIEH
jgi:hypothetical protein